MLVAGIIATTACGGDGKSGGSDQNNGPAATAAALSAPPKVSIDQVVFSSTAIKPGSEPDSSKLATSFNTDSTDSRKRTSVYGMVKLAEGLPGVRTAWLGVSIKYRGQTFERPPMIAKVGSWQQIPLFSEFIDNPPGGDYELVLTPLAGGDTRSGKFTINDAAAASAPKPKLDEALMVANYLGETRDKPNLKPSSFTETTVFKPTDFITVVFSLADPQPAAWATATWKYQGKQIGTVRASEGVIQGSVRGFILTEPRRPGQYEVTITLPETGETRTLKFSISPPEGVQSRFDNVGLVKQPAKGAQPTADAFLSSFDAFDKIAVASQVNPPPDTKTPNILHMAATYEGKMIDAATVRAALNLTRKAEMIGM